MYFQILHVTCIFLIIQVLELVMNSLSEFSSTEIAKAKPFETTNDPSAHRAQLPKTLAESIVLSKGFQSTLMLTGEENPKVLEWAGQLGTLTGLLWKTNFDWMKLSSQKRIVVNIRELNGYLAYLRESADALLITERFTDSDPIAIAAMRRLINFWGSEKQNY